MKTMLTNFLSVARAYKGTLVMNVAGDHDEGQL